MIKSDNFANVLTSELLFEQDSESEREKCKEELYRRLKSIGFIHTQVEKFIAMEEIAIIKGMSQRKYNETYMTKRTFIGSEFREKPNTDELTVSELLLITEEATDLIPHARAKGFEYFYTIYSFAYDKLAEGWDEVVKRLRNLGVSDDIIKKFIFAELQIIRRKSFNCESTVDAWGNPDKHLN